MCEIEQYPLPVIDDSIANLPGGEQFSILDLRDAYNQVTLDEDSRMLTVMNTHKRLFCYNQLLSGIVSASAIFQQKIGSVLLGLMGVQAYLDNVLIVGIKLHANKCRFSEQVVQYLGRRIDAGRLHPVEKNIDAVTLARSPQNIMELQAFLGIITFYNKFLSNMSLLLAPLYKLLVKSAKWLWGAKEEVAFQCAKSSLCTAPVLTRFDTQQELLPGCDASPQGIGAVLFHHRDGENRPTGFWPRVLTVTESRH